MNLDPRPMDPDRLSQLRYRLITGQHLPTDIVSELVGDRVWHRARVAVTDDDIRAAGLGDPGVCEECQRLVAWVAAHGLHVVNITNDDWITKRGRFPHGIWSADPRSDRTAESIAAASSMAHDWIINALAEHVGRAPLDVLAEIAATEVSDG